MAAISEKALTRLVDGIVRDPKHCSEARLQTCVQHLLTRYRWRWMHASRVQAAQSGRWITALRGSPGWVDIIAVRDGRALCLELKAQSHEWKPGQAEWLTALDQVPGIDALIVLPSDLRAVIDLIT